MKFILNFFWTNKYSRLKTRFTYRIFMYALVFACFTACQNKVVNGEERMPENALETFELEGGFQIELVAAEPLISDPVDMFIDEKGRMFVVEMHGYPLDVSGSGKIKMLTDSDGDGRMDQSIVFADNLILPTGIMRWKNGLLVTDPPNVYYLEDSDGDGKADIKEIVLTGFARSNPQHNVNSPRLGMDNWIYLGHESAVTTVLFEDKFGDQGSEIHFPNSPESSRLPQNAKGRSVRFRPDTHELEMLSSKTQFGHTWNTWGHRFLVNNNDHIIQEVLPAKYLTRNPYLLTADATQSISDHGSAAEVFPITENPEHQLLTDVGVMTSACGVLNYLGGAFPEGYENVVFVAEPVSNLVHMDILQDEGAVFTARRKHPDKEFLASTDSWFRPVNHYIGPDGALYIVDYYRQIIEHPEWMADEVVQSGALYNGTDKGRIYRISPEGTPPISWSNRLNVGDLSLEQLVEKLADPNIWWRQHAQRLLVDRIGNATLPALVQMARDKDKPLGRLHALWTLHGVGQLSRELIIDALKDPEPGIRENGIRLAEMHIRDFQDIEENLLSMVSDTSSKVRFQLLCTLGDLQGPKAARARHDILFRDIEEEWVQIAALSAIHSPDDNLLAEVMEKYREDIPAYGSLIRKLSSMNSASRGKEYIAGLLREATDYRQDGRQAWQVPVLEGLAIGLRNRRDLVDQWPEGQNLLIEACFGHPSIEVRNSSIMVLQVFELSDNHMMEEGMKKAFLAAENRQLPEEERVLAIRFLALSDPSVHETLFENLMNPEEPSPVQLAALQALSKLEGLDAPRQILEKWSVWTPEIRDEAINTFLVHPGRIDLLLTAMENGTVQKNEIGWGRSVQLMNQKDENLKSRSRAILTQKAENREEVVLHYQPALELKGHLDNGKAVYERNCMICHQMGDGVGYAFGPDLASLKNRRHANIMNDILDPNLSIADGYDLWSVELNNGEQLQGVIASETPTAIRLLNAGGLENTIARQDIKSLKVIEMSAMPVGLEENISLQEMADLLAFIKQEK